MADLVGSPDIILVWPKGQALSVPQSVSGYSVQVLTPELDEWWIEIHRKAVPSFPASSLSTWLERYRSLALEDGIIVATDNATKQPVATAGSIDSDKDGMFPKGGQLAWVATVPEYQKHGLATWLSALVTQRLIDEGFENIFLCTGDDLIPAISVYLKLGYLPCLYASDQADRWSKICDTIHRPYEPHLWPSIQDYLSSFPPSN